MSTGKFALDGALFRKMAKAIGLPVVGIAMFLVLWAVVADHIHTSLGTFPGPEAVAVQSENLYQDYQHAQEKKAQFYQMQEERNAKLLAQNPNYKVVIYPYTGQPTFVSQIGTSLVTVLSGFILASLIAIPLGIAIGLSSSLHAAVNPIIQILRPVSPLAWLPLVTIVVSALYASNDPMFSKSYLVSMITVLLCCLWPTIINTAVGVAAISQDLTNVSRVLRLNWWTHVRKIVVPSALPMMFTGLRLSLSIAWMVLIAAEMLAQNPGLGKFVWDEFQNGSSDSLSRIMVAVVVIGLIGFMLDRTMLLLQCWISWDKKSVLR
ncbi:MAG: nitrate ABC transporter permease [Halothiobacillus sp. 15-55-196]|jgi:nitrate/nitrite transport system permease protein|uniref:ABC transporter permease n=1 Tax=Halothiobacillus sp. 15-55-196 TaxID=1970382 RepID=UPI000BC60688|nr:ABC transporter permease [Halothiobacillus sp. 15-55-196]OZB36261.1 MAG: nitrate ABC transporter permease [Halothiobacillus sp. 15-55-196]